MDIEKINSLLRNYLTASEAASQLGIGIRAVQTACKCGLLPGSIQLARDWRIPPATIANRKKKYGVGPIPQKMRYGKKI
jgi:hypothetical protein